MTIGCLFYGQICATIDNRKRLKEITINGYGGGDNA